LLILITLTRLLKDHAINQSVEKLLELRLLLRLHTVHLDVVVDLLAQRLPQLEEVVIGDICAHCEVATEVLFYYLEASDQLAEEVCLVILLYFQLDLFSEGS
jgi:hypothetical protein